MPTTEYRIEQLRDFGLSEYAARVYLALLDLGVTEARDASALSKVPTSKIYHILEQLHKKGLATIYPEFPKRYAPVPFGEFLQKLRVQHEEAAKDLLVNHARLEGMFSVLGDVEANDRGTFKVIRGRQNTLEKLEELEADAEDEVLILGSHGFHDRARHRLDTMAARAEAGIHLRLMVPITEANVETLGPFAKVADLRARDVIDVVEGGNVTVAIADRRHALLIHTIPDDGHLYEGNDTAIYTDHEATVAMLRALVESQWSRSMPYGARLAHYAANEGEVFTRRHETDTDARTEFFQGLEGGVKEILAITMIPDERPDKVSVEMMDRLVESGARIRILINVDSAALARAYAEFGKRWPSMEMRHVPASVIARMWILDDREVFFTTLQPSPGSRDVGFGMIQTNHPATVAGMRAFFDREWTAASAVDARAKELDAVPDAQLAKSKG